MRGLENRIPPPLLMLGIGILMGATLLSAEPAWISAGIRLGLAVIFFVAAGLFGLPAFLAFGKAKTTIDPVHVDRASNLVTSGIYRLTRNPMYVGLSLLLFSWSGWLGRPLSTVGPIAFIAFINRFQIVPEERALASMFGQAYTDYRQSVRRWF